MSVRESNVAPVAEAPLPLQGFVLAGGQSRRMGEDKALLELRGTPMVALAVHKLRSFCAAVCIAAEREDLARFAPVVHGEIPGAGPVAGIEAGLRNCDKPWAIFIPVDVPLVPAALLRAWATTVVRRGAGEVAASVLTTAGKLQPAFCLFRRDVHPAVATAVAQGERRVDAVLRAAGQAGAGELWIADAERFVGEGETLRTEWFLNVNTPPDKALAESLLSSEWPAGEGAWRLD